MKHVLVSLMAQKAEVKYDPAYIIPSQIANRITDIGYKSSVIESDTVGQNTVDLKVCIYYTRLETHVWKGHLSYICQKLYLVRGHFLKTVIIIVLSMYSFGYFRENLSYF